MQLKELKLLLALAPIRLPHLEDEIFADLKLTLYYLETLTYPITKNISRMVHFYALYEMGCRWPAAEHLLELDPLWAYHYVKDVMNCRWPPIEPIMANHPRLAFWYAVDIVKGPWPEGEAAIVSAGYRLQYENLCKRAAK